MVVNFNVKRWCRQTCLPVALVFCCLMAGCGSKANVHNKKGFALYNKGKYEDAIAEFKKALELKPNHYDAHIGLGGAYSAKGMHDEAIAELKKAIAINPNDPKAYYNIAFVHVAKEDVASALPAYQKAIDLYASRKDKKAAEGYLYMAVAYSLIEKHEDAFATCKKAVEINPDLEDGRYFLGVCYYKKNMYDEAISEMKKALQINPKMEKAHSILFVIYDKLGRTAEADEENRIIRQFALERGSPQ